MPEKEIGREKNRSFLPATGIFARYGHFCPLRAFLPAAGIFARRGHFCPR